MNSYSNFMRNFGLNYSNSVFFKNKKLMLIELKDKFNHDKNIGNYNMITSILDKYIDEIYISKEIIKLIHNNNICHKCFNTYHFDKQTFINELKYTSLNKVEIIFGDVYCDICIIKLIYKYEYNQLWDFSIIENNSIINDL